MRIGGVLVTRWARTLADLVRLQVGGDCSPEVRDAARSLARRPGAAREAIVCLAMQNAVRRQARCARAAPPLGTGRGRGSGGCNAVDVVHGVDAATALSTPIEVDGVAHLEDEAAERQAIVRRGHRRREDVDVVLAEHAGSRRVSRPERSRASTWICTRKTLFEVGAHSTSIMRSGSALSDATLVQSRTVHRDAADRG